VACGLTQVQVARALGRQQAYVSKCELGERRIDPIDLLDFSVLYRKPLEYFLADSKSHLNVPIIPTKYRIPEDLVRCATVLAVADQLQPQPSVGTR